MTTSKAPTGLLLMMVSAFLFSLLGLQIKLLGDGFRVWDIATFRFGGGLVVLLMVFGRRERLFHPARPRLILTRGLAGTGAFLSLVIAIQQVSLSEAMVYFYSYPAFAAVFAALLFKDRIRRHDAFWIVLAFAGVAVLFDPHFEGAVFGRIMGITSAVFAGLTVTLIRELKKTHGAAIIYFFFCLVGGVVCLGPFLADPHLPHTITQWGLVAGIVATSVIAQLLMNHGFRYCPAWQGGLFMTSEVLYTTLFGIFLLAESVTWRFWLGGMLITGSTLASHLRVKTGAGTVTGLPRR